MNIFRSQKQVTEGVLARVIFLTFFGALILGGIGGLVGATFVGVPWQSTIVTQRGGEVRSSAETVEEPTRESEDLIAGVVERASPSVASILVAVDEKVFERSTDVVAPFGENSPFRIEIPRLQERGTKRRVVGSGTGFFISNDGLMLTNRHVVERADAIYTVVTVDGEEHAATVLDRDPVNDLAVLKVEGRSFPSLSFGDSNTIRIGQQVIAIGFALGQFSNTVSVGVISGLGRDIRAGGGVSGQVEALEDLIQTDAAINPGNSGGPLINVRGQVVGVNVAVAQGSQGIGFAIPVNAVKSVVTTVKQYGRIVRPQLGIRYTLVTPDIAVERGLIVDYGALLVGGDGESAVLPGSPAEAAGLREGDIILEFDRVRIDQDHPLGALITGKAVGDTVTLKIFRDGTELTIAATLSEWRRE